MSYICKMKNWHDVVLWRKYVDILLLNMTMTSYYSHCYCTLDTSRDTIERLALVKTWSRDVLLSNSVISMGITCRHVLSSCGNSREIEPYLVIEVTKYYFHSNHSLISRFSVCFIFIWKYWKTKKIYGIIVI